MRSDIESGGRFSDRELPDHTNVPGRLSELPGDDPLILGWDKRAAAAMAARL